MLNHIIRHGDDEAYREALETLRLSEQFRGKRRAAAGVMESAIAMSLFNVSASPGQKWRTIYDAENGTSLPGILVRSEGEPPHADIAVNEAYDGVGATYDLFYEVYDRNSMDDQGMPLESTVHFDINYDNAFWNGERMIFGDGYGQLFNRFTIAIDVIGHELTHGITQYEAKLVYKNESGALNESFSDVFGSLVKQRSLNQTADQADWLIGEGILAPTVEGIALRSMKEPGTAYNDPILGRDPQPRHYAARYRGRGDDGGVHINSGIPNYAFYLAANAIGGYAWEKAGKIWYTTLKDSLPPSATFQDAAEATSFVAEQLYGVDSDESKAVRSAWQQVGVM
jgi:Zn-dependent metalloprotease